MNTNTDSMRPRPKPNPVAALMVLLVLAGVLLALAAVTAPYGRPAPPPAKVKAGRRPVKAVVPKAPLRLSRTTLVAGDPDRDWVLVWAASGDLSPTTYKLGNTAVPRTSPLAGEDDGYPNFFGRLRIPAGTAPGVYSVDAGRGPEAAVTVVAAPPVRTGTVVPGTTSAEQTQKLLAQGVTVVTYLPGVHVFDRSVVVPGPATFYGYGGARIGRRAVNPTPDGKVPLFELSAAPGCSFCGLDVFYDEPSEAFRSTGGQTGLVLANCTFRNCNLGFYFAGAVVRDCVFDKAGAVIAPGGVWVGNTFVGRGPVNPFDHWGNLGPLALIDSTFSGTRRGPVFNAADGPIADGLFIGTTLRDINGTPNGCESFLCEGGTWDRHLVFRTRATNCLGAVFQPDRGGDSVLADDLAITGGLGLNLSGPATNWTVQNFELRDCGVWAPGATNCTFQAGSVVGWAPTRGPETFPNTSPGLLGRKAACVSGSPTNVLNAVNLWVQPPWLGQTGFTVTP